MALDVKALNEKSSKGALATLISVCALIIVTVVVLVCVVIKSNITDKSTKMFEKAFVQILDFNDATNIYSKQEMKDDIIKDLDEVIANYPNTTSGQRAVFYKAYILYNVEEYDEAINFFNYFIKKYNNSALIGKAYYFLSYCYEIKGDNDKAVEILQTFEKKNSKSYYVPMFDYRIATLLEGKDNAKAIEYYKKVTDSKENSSIKQMAKTRLVALENGLTF